LLLPILFNKTISKVIRGWQKYVVTFLGLDALNGATALPTTVQCTVPDYFGQPYQMQLDVPHQTSDANS